MSDEQKETKPPKEQQPVAPPDNPEASTLPAPEAKGSQTTAHTSLSNQALTVGTNKKGFKGFLRSKKGIALCIVVACSVVIAVVCAIPASRYAVAGLVIKKTVPLHITDSKTGKPVSGVTVAIDGHAAVSDGDGKAAIANVPVGHQYATTAKKNYKNGQANAFVPILSSPQTVQVSMVATGRQVPVVVVNAITGKPVSAALITADEATAITSTTGEATMVLPANTATIQASITVNGYNKAKTVITITEQQDPRNTLKVTPVGKVYFLSKRTGKIDVMKSDLDGANATVVLAGTGKESDQDTQLLASRDWKYLALKATRDSDAAKLYLISADTDKVTTIDEGQGVTFTSVGWDNEYFIYKVTRPQVQAWQPKAESLKSFDAKTGEVATLDDANGEGTSNADWAHENLGTPYILQDRIVYVKSWSGTVGSGRLSGKQAGIYSIQPNGNSRQTLAAYDAAATSFIDSSAYKPNAIYFRVAIPNGQKYVEYENGTVSDTNDVNDTNFYQSYSTYLVSPSGKSTFWTESRDGKNTLFIGDSNGANGKELTSDGSFKPYGWFSDDYILLSKNDSELYIAPANASNPLQPLKITDYHKPQVSITGYGYGYGGL